LIPGFVFLADALNTGIDQYLSWRSADALAGQVHMYDCIGFMTLLKDYYSQDFYQRLAYSSAQVLPGFKEESFLEKIYVPEFDAMELKQRMRHTTRTIHHFLSTDYKIAVQQILGLIEQLRRDGFGEDQLPSLFLPDYIECYGLDDFETSVEALELITQFITCEFAVRPFLLRYFDLMIGKMEAWSLHDSYKVRRLASEGSRPALPWGLAVPELKKDTGHILHILENLVNDPSESVRRSVANSLNDISKKHPDMVLQFARHWKGHSSATDALIKHACRTLLKKGHPEALGYFGFTDTFIELSSLRILTPELNVGDSLVFSFSVYNSGAAQVVRLEYAIYYKMANDRISKKVFKVSERLYEPGQKTNVNKRHSFRVITTRRFYSGTHSVSVIVNGRESDLQSFELL
jgi:3-methyladenine DNA glycosylase AlkC